MSVKLDAKVKKRAVEVLRQYCERELEHPIGNLDAEFLLDFIVGQVGPTIYNRAISDVQVYLRDRLAELDGDLFEPEATPGVTTLRYVLSGLFVVSVAIGLLLMVYRETRQVAGGSRLAVSLARRPALWFCSAAALLTTIVVLTILFPVGD